MILSRFVNPRASRMADMHASVPELHMRTFCTLGTSEQISFAIVTSNGLGMPKLVPLIGGGFDGGNDFRMRVAENGRPPGADVINQFIAVHVPDVRAFGPVDEERLAADGAKRAHGRVHAAGNVFQRLGKKLRRIWSREITSSLTNGQPERRALLRARRPVCFLRFRDCAGNITANKLGRHERQIPDPP